MSTNITIKWISDLLHQLQQQNSPGFYGGVKQIPGFIESFDINNNDDFINFGKAAVSDLDTLREYYCLGRSLLDVKQEADQKIMYARASAYFRGKTAYSIDSNSRIINFPIKRARIYLDDFHLEALCLFDNDYIKENKENLFSSVVSAALRAFLYNEDLLVFSLLREATLDNTITYEDKRPCELISIMRKIINSTGRNEISSNCFVIDELVWDYLSEDPDFVSWFDAAPESEITQGRLGSILGLDILTDAHLPLKLQTLQDGECFMTASPYVVGSITHRTHIKCRVFDDCPKDHKGWLFEQNEGMVLIGKEAVVRAIKKV